MSINIKTDELKKVLQISSLTTSKDKNNILNNCFINIKDSSLNIKSTDTIVTSIQTIKIDTDEKTDPLNNSEFLISPSKMLNIIKETPGDDIIIDIKNSVMTIKSNSFKTSIKTLNTDLYPKLETEDSAKLITSINYNILKKLIKSAIYCPDKNDISREYTGVFIEIKQNSIETAATDRFRLASNLYQMKETNKNELTTIIENEGASLITKLNIDNNIDIYRKKHSILLKTDDSDIEIKTIDSKFPDYKKILLDENNNFIELNKKDLLNSIKRVSILNPNNEVMLNINGDKLNISSENEEGEKSNDVINILKATEKQSKSIILNSKFISEFLYQLPTEIDNVLLYYKDEDKPIMFKTKNDKIKYKYIVVPIIK